MLPRTTVTHLRGVVDIGVEEGVIAERYVPNELPSRGHGGIATRVATCPNSGRNACGAKTGGHNTTRHSTSLLWAMCKVYRGILQAAI